MSPRVLMVATARPTFVVEAARARAEQARALVESLGATVVGPRDLVMTADDVQAATAYLDSTDATDDGYDLILHVCASFSDASPALALYAGATRPVLLWAMREPGPVGDRLWLNSLCGANLFAHALVRGGGQVRLLYGDPGEEEVAQTLRAALVGELPSGHTLDPIQAERAPVAEVSSAVQSLRGTSIGLLSDAPTGFTPSEFDEDLLHGIFGIAIARLDLAGLFRRIDDVDGQRHEEELAAARRQRPSLGVLDEDQVSRHADVTVALREWGSSADLSAMAIRCWPEIPTERGVCPCSSLSRIADEGIPTACERDGYGAVTMLLLEALGSGPTYLVDTVELDAEAGIVRVWHCGSAASVLAAEPAEATQGVHCNRKIGVAGNFPLRTGRVIMARLTEDVRGEGTAGLRLLITAGDSIPAPNRFQGNSADVRVDADAHRLVESLIVGGFPHHTVLAWTDVRPQLRTAADLLGIPVVEY